MKKITVDGGNQFFVYSDGTHYELRWEDNNYHPHVGKITQKDYEEYKADKRSGDDLLYKAAYGAWPPTEEQNRQGELEFLLSDLQMVHDISLPNDPNLFEEFPELKPEYEKWLSEQ
ncbi:hypothetical protein Hs30E_19930 [Lactococcus hodotermopsidis]|uniref:Uncharacterized protein n=1 Tax=Pseudolactococcus hodotermopsidis TaxID=2709157 RepID=A0A6A0BDF2_9LACT|nr:hypothetical protein [Lactococcus hodotermopsidis]GFH43442.1 hypothetical protein Hs30E_19930 [Lactococcus hodotermopsidis]